MNAWIAVEMLDPLRRFLDRVAELLPVLFAVLVVLVVGLLAAWLLESLVRLVLRSIQFDKVTARTSVTDGMRRAGLYQSPSDLVAQIVRWVVVVLALAGALSILSSEATDDVLSAMVNYLPRLAAGLLIFVVGYAVSTFVARSVLLWTVNAQLRGARWLAGGVQFLIGVFFAALALEHLGFGRDIALTVLAILLGGGVFAAALAFGLAGQELALRTLQRVFQDTREEDRDTISHL